MFGMVMKVIWRASVIFKVLLKHLCNYNSNTFYLKAQLRAPKANNNSMQQLSLSSIHLLFRYMWASKTKFVDYRYDSI